MTRVLVFGVVFAAAGCLLLFVALRLWRRHRREIDRLVSCTGRVVRNDESDVDGQRMYQPVVEYVAGESRVCTDSTYHGAPAEVGAPHVVFYDRDNPVDARLSKETGSLFGMQLLGTFAIAFLAIGLIALGAYVAGPESSFGAFVRDALS